MLNPKQHAKIEVLKHVSKMMDTMMSGKMKKKPAAMSVEADVIPKNPELIEGSPAEESLESPDMEAKEDSLPIGHLHKKGEHQKHADGLNDDDISRLRDHYSSIK